MNETIIGELKILRKATTKTNKEYIQVQVDDVFAFWWTGHIDEKLEIAPIGLVVEMEYKPGNFNNVVSLKKLGNPVVNTVKTNLNLVNLVLNWMEDKIVTENELCDYIISRNGNPEELIDAMCKAGEIFTPKPGHWRVL